MSNLRWKEPWGGSMLPEDTGLCNRLMHWEIAYGINRANDFKFNILVEQGVRVTTATGNATVSYVRNELGKLVIYANFTFICSSKRATY